MMRQIGTLDQAAIAGPEVIARAGAPTVLIAAAILGEIREMAAAHEKAIAVPALQARAGRRGRAALNPEHPLMGPHPTD